MVKPLGEAADDDAGGAIGAVTEEVAGAKAVAGSAEQLKTLKDALAAVMSTDDNADEEEKAVAAASVAEPELDQFPKQVGF